MDYDTIEDVTINVDEVNESFSRGYEIEGKQFLEKIEKQFLGNYNVNDETEKKIIKAFDGLARKLTKGKVEILNELERYGLNTEIITKLSLIGVQNTPKLSSLNKPPNASRNTTEDRYADEGFEDYENDFEDYDDVDKRAHTSNVVLPKYTDQEPNKLRSKTAPAQSQSSLPAIKSTPTHSGTSTRSSSKLKTMGWIKRGEWRLGEKIGSGSFGDVFQGMSDDGYLFAVKQLKIVDDKEIANLISEIELMQSLDHPNIVKYLGTTVDVDKGVVYIFQEWVPGGSVAHLLKRFGPFSIGVVRTYTKQILEGLTYLHEHGIVHRDIKGGNILVDDSGVVKLADFGASTTMAFGETVETTTIKGTPYFMAPEVLSESRYGRRGDVWAVGCTIIQMLTGEPPWKDKKLQSLVQLHLLLSSWHGIPPVDREIPEDLSEFLELCFEKDPKNRPMPKDLLFHKFLNPEDDLNDSLGGTNSNLREQLERAAARASFKPDDTFGDIDAILAQKAANKASNTSSASASATSSNQRERSSSTSSSHSDHDNSPPVNIISPTRQSTDNPFAKKSAAGLSPSPSAPQLYAAPLQSNSNQQYSKSVIRSSGLTISPAIEQLTISPPSTASSGASSSRRGSADPINIPSQVASPSTKSNASTPRIHEQPLNERKSTIKNDYERGHRRKNSNGSDDGTVPSNRHIHARRHQQYHHDETDVTPRSHHSNNNNHHHHHQSSLPSSSLPPSKFTFDNNKNDSTTQKNDDNQWQCENHKCRKFNPNDIDYCSYCAIKKGATGERGNTARLFAG